MNLWVFCLQKFSPEAPPSPMIWGISKCLSCAGSMFRWSRGTLEEGENPLSHNPSSEHSYLRAVSGDVPMAGLGDYYPLHSQLSPWTGTSRRGPRTAVPWCPHLGPGSVPPSGLALLGSLQILQYTLWRERKGAEARADPTEPSINPGCCLIKLTQIRIQFLHPVKPRKKHIRLEA